MIPIQSIKKVPIQLYVGSSDTNADVKDAQWLQSQVPTIEKMHVIDGFTHGDMQL